MEKVNVILIIRLCDIDNGNCDIEDQIDGMEENGEIWKMGQKETEGVNGR